MRLLSEVDVITIDQVDSSPLGLSLLAFVLYTLLPIMHIQWNPA